MAEISAGIVKQLREQTGAGMMDCKRALQECEGDFEAAKDWLRKKGQAIADKKATRAASEGLIFIHLEADGRTGAILELNCETDFVARNEKFPALGKALAKQIAKGGPGTESNEAFLATNSDEAGIPISELLRQNTATLGENILVGNFARVAAAPGNVQIQTYIHPPGKLGVLAEIHFGKAETASAPAFQELARDIVMHIAAAAPEALDRSVVSEEKLERERAIYRDQAINEGKGEKFLDKIVEGRVNKFFKESCLLEQGFVKNPDESITDLIKRVGKELGDDITITGFHRVKVGG